MPQEIRVPALGESVTEATVGQWFKRVGDAVAVDEPLVELETDKVTLEVPAPLAGVIESISADDGATVEVGAVLGSIDASGAAAAPAPAEAKPAPAAAPVAPAAVSAPSAAADVATPSPAARKVLAEKGIDAGAINGSGKDGRVTKADALAAAPAPVPAPAPQRVRAPAGADDAVREERVPMSRLRRT
ncbi:MAG: biotin/lipoyl-containing protein, partial [Alphaproteobacteria bacterium]